MEDFFQNEIYADFSASAPLHPEVAKYLKQRVDSPPFGNPNSLHSIGRNLSKGIRLCKQKIAKVLDAEPQSILLTSGSTEGIAHVVYSYFFKNNLESESKKKRYFLTSTIEHPNMVETLNFYTQHGVEVLTIPVTEWGTIDLMALDETLSRHQEEILLASFMAVNNETGIIQPVNEIGERLQKANIPFFSDTTQLIGKLPFSFNESPIDYALCSGHKIGALGGSGLLLSKNPESLIPLFHGSLQDEGLRSGTQNYLGLETITIALSTMKIGSDHLQSIENKKVQFERKLKERFPEIVVIGEQEKRLPSVSLISYPKIHSQALQIELESHNIFVTTSAACSDNEPHTSAVLEAMNISDEIGRGVLRFSVSSESYSQDFDYILEALTLSINKLKKIII